MRAQSSDLRNELFNSSRTFVSGNFATDNDGAVYLPAWKPRIVKVGVVPLLNTRYLLSG